MSRVYRPYLIEDEKAIIRGKEECPISIIPKNKKQLKREVILYNASIIKGNIFANKIIIYSGGYDKEGNKKPTIVNGYLYGDDEIILHRFIDIRGPVVSNGNIIIGRDIEADPGFKKKEAIDGPVIIRGSILSKENITLFKDVIVYGSIIAEGDVNLSSDCIIYGSIFGNNVYVGKNCFALDIIGVSDVILDSNVTIYYPIIRSVKGRINATPNASYVRCFIPKCCICDKVKSIKNKISCEYYYNDLCDECIKAYINSKYSYENGEIINCNKSIYRLNELSINMLNEIFKERVLLELGEFNE